MTKDEALKLALVALEDLGMKHFESTGEVLYKETFTAIKEALANDALERKAENARELGLNYEPEPYKVISDHITQTTGGRAYVDPVTGNVSVGTVAQPSVSVEQEYHAVNAVHKGQQCYVKTQTEQDSGIVTAGGFDPRTQRTWVGLTDEEIQTEWVLTPQNDKAEGIWFGRRIEAKLKEKNT